MKKFFVLFVVLFFLCPFLSFAYPKYIGRINDFANVLSTEQEAEIDQKLIAFEKATSIEIAVVTVTSLEGQTEIEYADGLGNEWKVGKKEKNNGIVFLLAPNERRCRIALGGGLANSRNNRIAQNIFDYDLKPILRNNRFDQGIITGVDKIIFAFSNDNQDTKAGIIFLGLLIAILIFVLLFSLIKYILDNKKLMKENTDNFSKLTSDFTKAKRMYENFLQKIDDLKKQHPASMFVEPSHSIQSLKSTLNTLNSDINTVKDQISKLTKQKIVQEKIDTMINENSAFIKELSFFRFFETKIESAKKRIDEIITTYPSLCSEIEELLKNPDVTDKNRELYPNFKKQLEDCLEKHQQLIKKPLELDWFSQERDFSNNRVNLIGLKAQITEEINFAIEAREQGPELLKKLKQKIAELKSKNFESSEAQQEIQQAEDKYAEAQHYYSTNSNNLNWLILYAILLNSQSHTEEALSQEHTYVAEQKRIQNESYHSHSDTSNYSSPSFTSFGGGGGFSGGGGGGGF